MSIEALRSILTPPRRPVDNDGDWAEAERELGFALPEDYRSFISIYGYGSINEFLIVFSPFGADRVRDALTTYSAHLRELREIDLEFDNVNIPPWPYPIFPEPGGLVPWGTTINGDLCLWLTAFPDPDDWFVVTKSRSEEWGEFPGSITSFLVAVLTREYVAPGFPEDFPSARPTFQPGYQS